MKMFFRLIFLLLLSVSNNLFAQSGDVEMADMMRSDGKIYVVISIICIILAGLFIYLISIDRKVRRLENKKS